MTWQRYKLNPKNSLLLEEYFRVMEQFDSTDLCRRLRQSIFYLFSFGVRRKFATFAPRLIDGTFAIQS